MKASFYLIKGVSMKGYLQRTKEDLLETLLLVKICLTSFWFWLPVLYAGYIFFQYWMIVYIHPLTIFILPVALIIYLFTQEESRMKARYGIVQKKPRKFFSFTFLGRKTEDFKWDLETTIHEYEEMVTKSQKKENST